MATAQNWNYKIVSLASVIDFWGRIKADQAQQMLDELGRQGWELTGIIQSYGQRCPTAYLKRPA